MPDSLLGLLDKNVSRAALLATPSSRPSFELYSRCRSDSTSKEALRLAADDPRSSTLPGFVKVLHGLLGRPSIPVAAEGGTSSERPLRYSAYASPKSTSSSSKSTADEKERHMRGGRGGMADSLMIPGALALVGIEQDLSDVRPPSRLTAAVIPLTRPAHFPERIRQLSPPNRTRAVAWSRRKYRWFGQSSSFPRASRPRWLKSLSSSLGTAACRVVD